MIVPPKDERKYCAKKDAVVDAVRELFESVEDQSCCVVIGSASVLSPEVLLKALNDLDNYRQLYEAQKDGN